MIAFTGRRRICIFVCFVLCSQVRSAESPKVEAPLIYPLAHAVLSPALRAVAERDHINLSAQETQSVAPAPGDTVVFWIGTARSQKTQQWLVELKRDIATPKEQQANQGKDVTRYLSWGPVETFHSEVDALSLWIAGPVNTNDDPASGTATRPLPEVRRARMFVPGDYMRLGLDDSVRANQYIDHRIQVLLKADPKFGFGHIYSLSKPIKPENMAWAKPVAERIGFSPAMERAWNGGYVALEAFYNLANDVPELKEIADVALDRPAPWKYVKLAFGSHFKTWLDGRGARLIDPAKAGLLPVALETFQVPFSFSLDRDPIVSGLMVVTSPGAPLDVSAGILALVAVHPQDRTRMVQMVAISATRGNSKAAQR
ncbi:MAG: hypothetical protein ABI273_05040 [Lacunisphaera sp.]